jgi:HTH-type transcriptional regulator / antitoxin HipB
MHVIVTDVRVLGAVVRQRRQALGWPQGKLAAAAGVSRPWVSEFEKGKTSVEAGLVFAVLDALGLHVNVIPSSSSRTLTTRNVAAFQQGEKAGAKALGRLKTNRKHVAATAEGDAKMVRPAITRGGKSIAAARARMPIESKRPPSAPARNGTSR